MGQHGTVDGPVTLEDSDRVEGPFFHGTKAALEVGDEVAPGFGSNFQSGRVSNNVCFTTVRETAVWGAELATALGGEGERGRIYVAEPMGPFEDDPNVTDKRSPGNRTRSYRSRCPLPAARDRRGARLAGSRARRPARQAGVSTLLREQGRDVDEDEACRRVTDVTGRR